jgi:hypothetical protein
VQAKVNQKTALEDITQSSILFGFFYALDESSNENNPSLPSNAFILNFNST